MKQSCQKYQIKVNKSLSAGIMSLIGMENSIYEAENLSGLQPIANIVCVCPTICTHLQ